MITEKNAAMNIKFKGGSVMKKKILKQRLATMIISAAMAAALVCLPVSAELLISAEEETESLLTAAGEAGAADPAGAGLLAEEELQPELSAEDGGQDPLLLAPEEAAEAGTDETELLVPEEEAAAEAGDPWWDLSVYNEAGEKVFFLDLFKDGSDCKLTAVVTPPDGTPGGNSEVVWTVIYSDETGNETPLPDLYTLENDGMTLVLNGSKLKELTYREIIVSATLNVNGSFNRGTNIHTYLNEAYSSYSYPVGPEEFLIPGWSWEVNPDVSAYVRNQAHPNGATIDLPITSAAAGKGDSIVRVSKIDKEGWKIEAVAFGQDTVTFHFTDENGKAASFETVFWVKGDVYEAVLDTESGSQEMLSGETVLLNAEVRHWQYQEGVGIVEAPADNASLAWSVEWETYNGSDEGTPVTLEEQGTRSVKVISNDKNWSGGAHITAAITGYNSVTGKQEAMGTAEYYLYVNESYYEIHPIRFPVKTMKKGDSVTISPEYVGRWYKEDGTVETNKPEEVRFRWEYDPEVIKITDQDGNPAGGADTGEYQFTEASYGQGKTFTVTMLKDSDWTEISLHVETKDSWSSHWYQSGTSYYYIQGSEESRVTGISADIEAALVMGSTTKLHAQVDPPTAENQKILWESANPAVATVSSDGTVKGITPGIVIITATTEENGYTAEIPVTVQFKDVVKSSAWFYKPVYWAVGEDITTGYKDKSGNLTGMFGPEDPCTREQIVTFLWRMMGSPEPKTTASFKDVDQKKYYAKAISWAAENAVTTGVSDTEFGVGQTCTREMCVTFLYRAAGKPPVAPGAETFTDVKAGKYYVDAVAWAAANEITTGYKDASGKPTGIFGVGDKCTRGHIVTFLQRTSAIIGTEG